ncbi:MAG: sugar phosphate isomerase/epimerase family protein [Planctomycetota bacterium]
MPNTTTPDATMPRRRFIQSTLAAGALATGMATAGRSASGHDGHDHDSMPYQISLAEWSLHRTLRDKSLDYTNLDFPKLAKQEFGISGIEYVNQFFADKANDTAYLAQLQQRCDDEGVTSLLIMVDREGKLGDANDQQRRVAVENHFKWVDAAKYLGCHSIRVNAASSGSYVDQIGYAADGLRQLSEHAAEQGINVIVENHGGLSSNAAWLAVVMERVGMDNCGTLPDFGNFYIRKGKSPELFDRYHGVQALMPYAKAVSAKTYDFDEAGNETTIDYTRMMSIVTSYGYHGYVGIEYEGKNLGEMEGIRASKALLERVGKSLMQATASS